MPKVSVILPVYGVEKFIIRCVRSLFEQTLDDIEYIFVNDCTLDNSIGLLKSVLEEYPNRRPQVKIINHENNKGLPQARKSGLNEASGDYIIHCDTDDWVDVDMYRLMYEKAIKEDADIVVCDFYRSDGITHRYIKAGLNKGLLQGPVWNKLVNVKIYKEHTIIFPTANKAEDGVIMTQLSFYSKKRAYVEKPLYYYFINTQSICGQISEKACVTKLQQECLNVDLRVNFLREHGVLFSYKKEILTWKLQARDNLLPILIQKEYYKMWLNTYPEVDKEILTIKSLRLLIKYLLVRLKLMELTMFFLK